MQALHRSPCLLYALLLAFGTVTTNLLFATVSLGETLEPSPSQPQHPIETRGGQEPSNLITSELETTQEAVPPIAMDEIPQLQDGQVTQLSTDANDLQLERSLDPAIQTRELGLMPGANEPQSGEPQLPQWRSADAYAQASDAQGGGDSFTFRFGSRVPIPTALQGATRPRTVLPGTGESGGISAIVRIERPLGDGAAALEVEGGEHVLNFDLGYNSDVIAPRRGFGVNIFNQRSYFPGFQGGDRDVNLPNGDEMWLHRLGGGVEYYQPVIADVVGAVGVSYQRVSVRDDVFTSDVEPVDEFGNRLTVDGDGIDDLATLNIALIRDLRDSPLYPTTGSLIRFGIDQGVTLGSRNIGFNRLSANVTQYIPLSLFGFAAGPRTLVLNLQGGAVIGDVPPYEAFNLGGVNSVRGYGKGDLATGSRFIQATAEYRFPIFNFDFRDREVAVGGVLFVDYASALDSQDDVIGEPGNVRDKPGDGLGFGVGLRIRSPIGPIRAEFGLNDEGDSELYITTGARF